MQERNGVRVGQRVRDLDGTSLGKVTRVFETGFATRTGLPILIGLDHVIGYGEVLGVRDGELIVRRSKADVFELAGGGAPRAWAPNDRP